MRSMQRSHKQSMFVFMVDVKLRAEKLYNKEKRYAKIASGLVGRKKGSPKDSSDDKMERWAPT